MEMSPKSKQKCIRCEFFVADDLSTRYRMLPLENISVSNPKPKSREERIFHLILQFSLKTGFIFRKHNACRQAPHTSTFSPSNSGIFRRLQGNQA